ncbi:MAG: helix-turn-helix domain-containing protein [Planctomycetota bacterium]
MVDQILTVNQIAEEFQVDASTVRRWIDSGKLERIPMPSTGESVRTPVRVFRSAIDTMLRRQEAFKTRKPHRSSDTTKERRQPRTRRAKLPTVPDYVSGEM